jgi:hypothetical protein
MRMYSMLLATAFLVPLTPGIQAQQSQAVPPIPLEDRSPYQGIPVDHPESLSGLWETSNGKGGAVGIHLLLTTNAPADATTLDGIQQLWLNLEVGVYARKDSTIQFGEMNYFSDSPRGGNVSYEDGRLQLHFVAPLSGDNSIDLDLKHKEDGSWTGWFHRGSFDSTVTLRRPHPDSGKESRIVGTWLETRSVTSSCVHIAQTSATGYVGWSDALQILGEMRFANGIPRAKFAMERYGELMAVSLQNSSSISLQLYAYNAMCCSHRFVGTLSEDGASIQGIWPPGANQAPHDALWRRMAEDSCTSSKQ